VSFIIRIWYRSDYKFMVNKVMEYLQGQKVFFELKTCVKQ